MNSELVDKIIKILDNKKAIDIQKIDIQNETTIADYFIIASGTSNTHVKSLADNIEEDLKKEQIYPNTIEGYDSGVWILMDYGEAIVHIFTSQEREHYSLEDLWNKIKNGGKD